MKRVFTIGGIVVTVIAAFWIIVAVFVFPSIESTVKAAVEKIGSDLTQTTVLLDDVKLSLADGKGRFRGLRMTNPKGFQEDDAFAFDEVAISVDLGTMASEVVVIDEIIIRQPRILYEMGAKGTNIDTIRSNVASRPGDGGTGDDGETPSFIIKDLYLRDGTLSVAASGFFDRKINMPMPDIHLTDVGQNGAGASPGDIVEQTLTAVGGGITTAVAEIDLDSMRQGIENAADSTGKAIEDAAESTGETAGEVGQSIEKKAGDVGQSIGNKAGEVGKSIGEGAEKAGQAVGEGAEAAGKAIKDLLK